ncbi:MAG: RelA/SpoT family protein [Candidatus Colwellbacteria bacterium]|nr:RelA/SpoT family protein [Candidatus Colwellbacteria bacterium]
MKTATLLTSKSDLVQRAYAFAEKAHAGQKRKSGEPYFNHCLKTAEELARWKLDETTIAAGLLHDVIENTDYTAEDVEQEFGPDIKRLVEGVTKLGTVKYRGVETQVENLRKLILAMAEDIRVILIKLADRLHNMRTLNALPPTKQKRIALETMEIYAPLAYRLGMQKLSGQLEDLSFPYVYPTEYRWLLANIKGRYEKREAFLMKIRPLVLKALKENGIEPVALDFRAKRYTSLYKKLLRYEMDIDKIHDLVAFRIIVKTIEDCYAALGVIHNLWPPVPGRIKDYIAMPKPNGYRSIHTTIICTEGEFVEFQIRTEQIHQEVENGIAAHWAYVETKGTKNYSRRLATLATNKEIAWVEQLRAWQKQFTDPKEFIDSLKIDFLKDRIFAITPKGEVIDLPQEATPVDFAYHIHSDIGNECIGAKVNGKIVPLDYELHSSDIVEIITQKNKKPSSSWLEFVKTATAKGHIREALRKSGLQGRILSEKRKKQTELKITAAHQFGLMKKISGILSRSHVNIISMDSTASRRRGHFYLIKIRCDTSDKDKILKIILKLKELKEIKEIDSRFV